MLDCLEKVVVVIPINPDVGKAEHIAEKDRKQWLQ
jgi:hypothetical protein